MKAYLIAFFQISKLKDHLVESASIDVSSFETKELQLKGQSNG